MHDTLALLAQATTARRHGRLHAAAERDLEAAFACSRVLAVYGSLSPGEPNAGELAACPGTWSHGTVTGRRAQREYPLFTFDPAATPLPVQVLHSDALPAHWGRLDEFEGSEYRRILVPVVIGERMLVANLFEAAVAVP